MPTAPSERGQQAVCAFFGAIAHLEEEHAAVGWKTRETQLRNFAGVSQVFAHERSPFTVYDVGCGLGAYAAYLREHFPLARYSGCDIVRASIERARREHPGLAVEVRDIVADPPPAHDYVVAAGIFNLHHGVSDLDWWPIVQGVLQAMYGAASKGIAATFLSSEVDFERPFGRYQDPRQALAFSLDELSRCSELRHGYYPYEFTLMAYREARALA